MAEAQNESIVNLDDTGDFEYAVLKAPVPVIVDLWAPWCGPCQVQGPILEQFARVYADRVRVVKINIDRHPELAKRFRVHAIPTLLVFKDGNQTERLVGIHSIEDLKKSAAL